MKRDLRGRNLFASPLPNGTPFSQRAVRWGRWALVALAAAGGGAAAPASSAWRTLRNARLNEEAFYDGDSFELVAGRHRRVYRLYFVDAPETDDTFPDRVKEQAKYFRVTPDRVRELGGEARKFAREFLKDGATVYHLGEDAGGRAQRYFAMVQSSDGRFLCEALVAAGLARVYGAGTDLPDGTPEARHWVRLRAAERRAKEAGTGGWSERLSLSRERGVSKSAAVLP